LIWMYGGVEEMSLEEVKMACVERGVDVLERKETDLRADLQNWLDSREKVPVEKLLLTRYVPLRHYCIFTGSSQVNITPSSKQTISMAFKRNHQIHNEIQSHQNYEVRVQKEKEIKARSPAMHAYVDFGFILFITMYNVFSSLVEYLRIWHAPNLSRLLTK